MIKNLLKSLKGVMRMTQSNNKLVIIGAGSLGIMALDAAINQGNYLLEQILFIDDGKQKGEKIYGVPIIGGIIEIENLDLNNHEFIIAIANNKVRKEIAETYDLKYINIIHPAAVISSFAEIGVGNIILPNVSIDPETVIHNHVIINKNTSLGHNVIMKNYSQVSPGCQLGGTVGECTFIGLGATLLPNIKIGDYSTIGAGAVVNKEIPNNCKAIGVPAKVIK